MVKKGTLLSDNTSRGEGSKQPKGDKQHGRNALKADHRRFKSVWLAIVCLALLVLTSLSLIIALYIEMTGNVADHAAGFGNQTCMDCSLLQNYVDKWAWTGVQVKESANGVSICCMENDRSIVKMLRNYVDLRQKAMDGEITDLKTKLSQLHWENNNANLTNQNINDTSSKYHMTWELMNIVKDAFHRTRSVLHVKSGDMSNVFSSNDPKIHWSKETSVVQGNLGFVKDTFGIQVRSSGLYYISVTIMYTANDNDEHTSKATTLQFYLAKESTRHRAGVEDYRKYHVFTNSSDEIEATVHTIAKLESGDRLVIHVPVSQKKYLSTDHGVHRISIFELY